MVLCQYIDQNMTEWLLNKKKLLVWKTTLSLTLKLSLLRLSLVFLNSLFFKTIVLALKILVLYLRIKSIRHYFDRLTAVSKNKWKVWQSPLTTSYICIYHLRFLIMSLFHINIQLHALYHIGPSKRTVPGELVTDGAWSLYGKWARWHLAPDKRIYSSYSLFTLLSSHF